LTDWIHMKDWTVLKDNSFCPAAFYLISFINLFLTAVVLMTPILLLHVRVSIATTLFLHNTLVVIDFFEFCIIYNSRLPRINNTIVILILNIYIHIRNVLRLILHTHTLTPLRAQCCNEFDSANIYCVNIYQYWAMFQKLICFDIDML
jgi:hypothetical protein